MACRANQSSVESAVARPGSDTHQSLTVLPLPAFSLVHRSVNCPTSSPMSFVRGRDRKPSLSIRPGERRSPSAPPSSFRFLFQSPHGTQSPPPVPLANPKPRPPLRPFLLAPCAANPSPPSLLRAPCPNWPLYGAAQTPLGSPIGSARRRGGLLALPACPARCVVSAACSLSAAAAAMSEFSPAGPPPTSGPPPAAPPTSGPPPPGGGGGGGAGPGGVGGGSGGGGGTGGGGPPGGGIRKDAFADAVQRARQVMGGPYGAGGGGTGLWGGGGLRRGLPSARRDGPAPYREAPPPNREPGGDVGFSVGS